MQLPSTTDGLRQSLAGLGFPNLLDGLDLSRSDIVQVLTNLVDSNFLEGNRDDGADQRRADVLSLIVRYPWRKMMSPEAQDQIAAAHAALVDLEKALSTPGRPSPPAKVMQIQEVDEEAGEVTLAPGKTLPEQELVRAARYELSELTKKGVIPRFKYLVKATKGAVTISMDSGRDSMDSLLNLPALLCERLQGSGFIDQRDRRHGIFRPVLRELEALLGEKLKATVLPTDLKVRDAISEKVLGHYIQVMGHAEPLFDVGTYRSGPRKCVEAYRDLLSEAGYSSNELQASTLALLMAKPSRDENAGLIKKFAQMFYSATLGAPAAKKDFNREAYLAHVKDMRSKYPSVDLESPTFEQALQDEAERYWNARTLRGAGVDW